MLTSLNGNMCALWYAWKSLHAQVALRGHGRAQSINKQASKLLEFGVDDEHLLELYDSPVR
jgi:hypothetical protein